MLQKYLKIAKYDKHRITCDSELIYGGQEYYAARNWGKDNVKVLTSKITAHFPAITYQLHAD